MRAIPREAGERASRVAFRERFPEQFQEYARCCREKKDGLVGTCLLLPAEKYTIACLFTSRNYGRNKDKPDQILAATKTTLGDLVRQNTEGKELHACRFNSGKFGVPWERTASIVEELGVTMTVYSG
ncbi:hypothetical protein NMY22_g150 [Coprinellus aureogranulatus]|nr:hypothetical protein NMY22_g150 [Coprinellus aureogranulatus]